MKCTLAPDHPVTADAAKKETGRPLKAWFALLDEAGGPKQGRAAVGKLLTKEHELDPWWATTVAVEYEKHHDLKKKDGLYEGYSICSTKTLAAPLADVYEAWTRPEVLSRWFGAKSRIEATDGGSYANADGDAGTFLRVRPGKDLRFTWENPGFSAPSRVDVTFQAKGDKTWIVVNHSRIQQRAEADGLRSGWGEALNRLKGLLES